MDRDVGRMGEATFSQWCASEGLPANSSKVDMTGWDFLVEFDFPTAVSSEISMIHVGAFDCKVQVKATDKNNGSWGIKLSVLKRMVTAPMPCFFLFLEFDGKSVPQRAFLRHVDNDFCVTVLKRLHDEDIAGHSLKLHKKSMVVKYDQSHQLHEASGNALIENMRRGMGLSLEKYVSQKMAHIKSAGFEEGSASMTFFADEDATRQLIDMSIGLNAKATVSNVEAVGRRFGKKSREPFLKEESLTIELMDVSPSFDGTIKFRQEKLGPYLSFSASIYLSGFNAHVPKNMRKARIKSDFFDILFNPYTHGGSFTFLAPARSMKIQELANGLRVAEMLSNPEKSIYMEIEAAEFSPIKFEIKGSEHDFDYRRPLQVLDASLRILSHLQMYEQPNITWPDVMGHGMKILALNELLMPDTFGFHPSFSLLEGQIPQEQKPLCLLFYSAPIGDVKVGAFVSMTGKLLPTHDDRYMILPETKSTEKIVVRKRGEATDVNALIAIKEELEQRYDNDYAVFSLIEKKHFKADGIE